MKTMIAVSTPSSVSCAHCERLIFGSGVAGPWLLRPCSDRMCREENDGAWNLIVCIGSVAISMALSRRFAQALVQHLDGMEGRRSAAPVIAAAGSWRCGEEESA